MPKQSRRNRTRGDTPPPDVPISLRQVNQLSPTNEEMYCFAEAVLGATQSQEMRGVDKDWLPKMFRALFASTGALTIEPLNDNLDYFALIEQGNTALVEQNDLFAVSRQAAINKAQQVVDHGNSKLHLRNKVVHMIAGPTPTPFLIVQLAEMWFVMRCRKGTTIHGFKVKNPGLHLFMVPRGPSCAEVDIVLLPIEEREIDESGGVYLNTDTLTQLRVSGPRSFSHVKPLDLKPTPRSGRVACCNKEILAMAECWYQLGYPLDELPVDANTRFDVVDRQLRVNSDADNQMVPVVRG